MPVGGINQNVNQNEDAQQAEMQERGEEETQAIERRKLREQGRERADEIYQNRSERHRQDLKENRQRARGEIDTTA